MKQLEMAKDGGYQYTSLRDGICMKPLKVSLSIIALVLVNLLPLYGVAYLGWDAVTILLLYWTENFVVGFYSILKLIFLRARSTDDCIAKIILIPFFILHFGLFTTVHGIFVFAILGVGGGGETPFPGSTLTNIPFLGLIISVLGTFWRDRPPGMDELILGLFLSHGISFIRNYLMKGEYARMTVKELMFLPYRRVSLLHLAIIFGGALTVMIGSPVGMLYVLILLKICFDVYFHVKEHALARGQAFGQTSEPSL